MRQTPRPAAGPGRQFGSGIGEGSWCRFLAVGGSEQVALNMAVRAGGCNQKTLGKLRTSPERQRRVDLSFRESMNRPVAGTSGWDLLPARHAPLSRRQGRLDGFDFGGGGYFDKLSAVRPG